MGATSSKEGCERSRTEREQTCNASLSREKVRWQLRGAYLEALVEFIHTPDPKQVRLDTLLETARRGYLAELQGNLPFTKDEFEKVNEEELERVRAEAQEMTYLKTDDYRKERAQKLDGQRSAFNAAADEIIDTARAACRRPRYTKKKPRRRG